MSLSQRILPSHGLRQLFGVCLSAGALPSDPLRVVAIGTESPPHEQAPLNRAVVRILDGSAWKTLPTRGSEPVIGSGESITLSKDRIVLHKEGGHVYTLAPIHSRVASWSKLSAGTKPGHETVLSDSTLPRFTVTDANPVSGRVYSMRSDPSRMLVLDMNLGFWKGVKVSGSAPSNPWGAVFDTSAIHFGRYIWIKSESNPQPFVLQINPPAWITDESQVSAILSSVLVQPTALNDIKGRIIASRVCANTNDASLALVVENDDSSPQLSLVQVPLVQANADPRWALSASESANDVEWLPSLENEDPQPFDDVHDEACINNEHIYKDPATGFTCFSRVGLLERGFCCGNKCRHCPYSHCNVPPGKK